MEQVFNDYITFLVEQTFGFTPKVRIETPNEGVVKVFLDGDETERRQLMGHSAQNFHAIKQLLICFSKRHSIYAFLYLEFKNETYSRQY